VSTLFTSWLRAGASVWTTASAWKAATILACCAALHVWAWGRVDVISDQPVAILRLGGSYGDTKFVVPPWGQAAPPVAFIPDGGLMIRPASFVIGPVGFVGVPWAAFVVARAWKRRHRERLPAACAGALVVPLAALPTLGVVWHFGQLVIERDGVLATTLVVGWPLLAVCQGLLAVWMAERLERSRFGGIRFAVALFLWLWCQALFSWWIAPAFLIPLSVVRARAAEAGGTQPGP
jgi:hypothetical protein